MDGDGRATLPTAASAAYPSLLRRPGPRRTGRIAARDVTRGTRTRKSWRISMPRNVRGALLQATWTGDKESMIQKHEGYA
ncbi:MAG: hypothetical protein ACYC65_05780, partial [Candidatus Limnocylindrales bacterium]